MRYINSFMKSYKVIMEEQARQAEFIRRLEVDKILKQHHERLTKIEEKLFSQNKKKIVHDKP